MFHWLLEGNPKVPALDTFIWGGEEERNVCEVAIWGSSRVHQAHGGWDVGVQQEITGN